MNELAVSTSNILNSIEPALTKLSETFCISADYLKENAMQYILMYGEYEYVTKIIPSLVIGMLVGLIVLIIYSMSHYDEDEEKLTISKRKIFIVTILSFFITFVFLFSISTIKYFASPEIYSIKAVIELLQKLAMY